MQVQAYKINRTADRNGCSLTFAYMKNSFFSFLFFSTLILLLLFGCRKEDDLKTGGVNLSFSTDTLTFDTVFTTLGSVTKRFKVHNKSDEDISINTIRIKKGDDSMFRMNVDGTSGDEVKNIEIKANDSVFIFIEVTVDPTNQNSPLVELDAVEFLTDDAVKEVVLEAWGQDAYYYYPDQYVSGFPQFSQIISYDEYFPISTNITFPNDKPHVIFGYLYIDSAVNVTIPAGTQIHLYNGAGLWVSPHASIQVEGEKDNEVVFQGIRLEDYYDDVPGQWDRIWINESETNSTFNYAIIKNAYIGIQAEEWPFVTTPSVGTNELILRNTIIEQMDGLGILARNYNVRAENCLFTNSQNQLVAVQGGGNLNFLHCTFANYWSYGGRSSGSFFATNGYNDAYGVDQFLPLNINVENSIVYGNNREEIEIDSLDGSSFEYVFDHCVLKTELETENNLHYQNCVINPEADFGYYDPLFYNASNMDFSLYSVSKAIGVGSPTLTDTLTIDLAGNLRDSSPDAGCYEFQ